MTVTGSRLVIAGAVLVACLGAPLVIDQTYQLNVLFRVFLFAGLGVAWNLVGGYTGQLSLGHAAFFGLGAYGLAIGSGKLGLPIPVALGLAIALAVLVALAIGLVAFRLRGPYFALATIAFAEVLHLTAKNLPDVTGGEVGLQVPLIFPPDAPSRWFYWAAVVLTALALAITALITRARFGYALLAIREDEDTALACGIATTRTKLHALMISAALTAIGGALYGSLFLYIVPDQMLSVDISNEIAIVAMLGGAGTLLGPLVGAVLLEIASELFKNLFQEAHLVIYGVLIVVVVLFLPEGIVGTIASALRRRRGRA
ncbi:MAG TPA: branched-chain amino acid ABC transporter permease [Kofleriaceae bacterium]|nr:branched-chain amino acid ABC transporter permease [Kofleriaceae bacterium]